MKPVLLAATVLLIIVIAAIGVYALFPGLLAKDCGSELSCMRNAFDSCSMAKYSREIEIEQYLGPIGGEKNDLKITEYTEIRGPGIGGCRMFVKWTDADGSLAEWKGAEMNCLIDPDNYNLTYNGLKETCEGSLVEAYSPDIWTTQMWGMKQPIS